MGVNRYWNRVAARIALFAVLLATLAPTISHAVAAATGANDHWVQVCVGTGVKLVKLDSNGVPQTPAPTASHLEHCPFCLNHIGAVGILPAAIPELPILRATESFPTLFLVSHRPLFAWASAQARAPPCQS